MSKVEQIFPDIIHVKSCKIVGYEAFTISRTLKLFLTFKIDTSLTLKATITNMPALEVTPAHEVNFKS